MTAVYIQVTNFTSIPREHSFLSRSNRAQRDKWNVPDRATFPGSRMKGSLLVQAMLRAALLRAGGVYWVCEARNTSLS
jgi:hypothetical protein